MSVPGFNGKRYILDIAATGTFTPLPAVGPVRFVTLKESTLKANGTANTLQGWVYKLPNDGTGSDFVPGFSQVFAVPADQVEEVTLGDRQAINSEFGILLGESAQPIVGIIGGIPATVLAQLSSATATATSIEVTQYF